MNRRHTQEEMRGMFLDQLDVLVTYWAELPDKNVYERLDGLAFSILTMLDGDTMLPMFDVVARPHPDDRAWHEVQEENWWPEGEPLGGPLHEYWCTRNKT